MQNMKKEVETVAVGTAALCLIMYGVFALLGKYGLDVILGTIIGYILCTGNFLLLALTVNKAVSRGDEGYAKRALAISQSLRFLLIFAVGFAGFKLSAVNGYAVVIPLVFTRLVVFFSGRGK